MNIDSILTEWTFRLEYGFPTKESDYDDLHDVIMEMTDLSETEATQIVLQSKGLTEDDNITGMGAIQPDSEVDDFADLIELLKNSDNITAQFKELSRYTSKHYNPTFDTKFAITDINDHLDVKGHYDLGNGNRTELPLSNYTSPGIAAEAVIFTYMNANHGTSIQHQQSQAKGVDGTGPGDLKYEVKTVLGGKSINLNLQTTFFPDDPNKFYIFAFRNGPGYQFNSFDPIYIVSSQLLRKISLGEEIYSQLGSESQISDILNKQIAAGLEKTNFKDQITAAITTGDTAGFTKQFDIGNNVSIVFKIFIQPKRFYGK